MRVEKRTDPEQLITDLIKLIKEPITEEKKSQKNRVQVSAAKRLAGKLAELLQPYHKAQVTNIKVNQLHLSRLLDELFDQCRLANKQEYKFRLSIIEGLFYHLEADDYIKNQISNGLSTRIQHNKSSHSQAFIQRAKEIQKQFEDYPNDKPEPKSYLYRVASKAAGKVSQLAGVNSIPSNTGLSRAVSKVGEQASSAVSQVSQAVGVSPRSPDLALEREQQLIKQQLLQMLSGLSTSVTSCKQNYESWSILPFWGAGYKAWLLAEALKKPRLTWLAGLDIGDIPKGAAELQEFKQKLLQQEFKQKLLEMALLNKVFQFERGQPPKSLFDMLNHPRFGFGCFSPRATAGVRSVCAHNSLDLERVLAKSRPQPQQ